MLKIKHLREALEETLDELRTGTKPLLAAMRDVAATMEFAEDVDDLNDAETLQRAAEDMRAIAAQYEFVLRNFEGRFALAARAHGREFFKRLDSTKRSAVTAERGLHRKRENENDVAAEKRRRSDALSYVVGSGERPRAKAHELHSKVNLFVLENEPLVEERDPHEDFDDANTVNPW